MPRPLHSTYGVKVILDEPGSCSNPTRYITSRVCHAFVNRRERDQIGQIAICHRLLRPRDPKAELRWRQPLARVQKANGRRRLPKRILTFNLHVPTPFTYLNQWPLTYPHPFPHRRDARSLTFGLWPLSPRTFGHQVGRATPESRQATGALFGLCASITFQNVQQRSKNTSTRTSSSPTTPTPMA